MMSVRSHVWVVTKERKKQSRFRPKIELVVVVSNESGAVVLSLLQATDFQMPAYLIVRHFGWVRH